MPYVVSVARSGADQRIADLKQSRDFVVGSPDPLPTYLRDAIFQNCVFQLSSIIEDYFKEITVAWFSKLVVGKAPTASLPILTRIIFSIKTQEDAFKTYLIDGDEVKLANKLLAQSVHSNLLDDTKVIPDLKYFSQLINKKKFPKPENVLALFRRIGINNIFYLMNRRTKSDVELALKSFIDIRNTIAHQSPPSITDVDVDRYLAQVTAWIEGFDIEIYEHVKNTSGEVYW